MSRDLKFLRSDFPKDWDDDIRMNFLFSNFRDRSVNPEGYDAKMNFWINTIQDLCLKSQSPVFSLSTLCFALERKNRQPMCLDVVLDNMIRQGVIMNISEYNKIEQDKGWLGWGFDVLVQKPVSWGFSSVQNYLNLGKKDDRFVVLPVVKELASKVLKCYYGLIGSKWSDNAIFYDYLKEECKDICSASNFELAVMQLQREKMVYVSEEYGERVIKFRNIQDKKIEPITEYDRSVLCLKKVEEKVTREIEDLEGNMLSCQNEAKENLRNGLKSKAMFALKKKKRLENILKKKTVALDNIENLLCQIKNAGSEKMVLDAYKSSVQAMKVNAAGDLDLDNVDEIMSGVKEAMDDYSEVQNSISRPVSEEDDSLEDFESELAELMNDEDKQNRSNKPRKEPSPARNTDEDLLRRLEALRAPPQDVSPVKKPAFNKAMKEQAKLLE